MTDSLALIGSRRSSAKVNKMCFLIGFLVAQAGYRGRSGGAPGPDTSFEMGMLAYQSLKAKYPDMPGSLASNFLDVYLPSYRFANRKADGNRYLFLKNQLEQSQEIASQFHQGWGNMSQYVRQLMARNAHQVLGRQLDEADKVVKTLCYTPDGASKNITSDTGGTGQALRMCNHYGVPIDNIGNPRVWAKYEARIAALKETFAPWVDLDTLYEETCLNHAPGFNLVFDDLLSDQALENIDVLFHGSNCIHKMKSGFAKQLVEKFPEALEADLATPKGAKKLGTYSSVEVQHNGRPITIVNAYTQAAPASWKQQQNCDLVADYEAIRKSLAKVRKDFSGARIAMPKVGAGLANGCWLSIGHIIGGAMYDQNVTVFDLPPEQRLERTISLSQSEPTAQMGMPL